ncbi:SIR2 family protein [Aeromonas sp. FDAARGOS 1417]|uniref:SIR2 family protein n=1 Tax=Aeromonas TaxID=642 RepID=UPI001C233B06|nr:SIR2 family protein [Aeromonas sp. FDAARGOS 1417]QWZ64049.1 SIR2 family protein [Aeromonas sp. FDAARGOS 1417]
MNIKEFMSSFHNHPVLFVGTGVSLRYLRNSYTWDALLLKIATELTGNDEKYYDIKSGCIVDGVYKYELVASKLEDLFNRSLIEDRDGKFKNVNDCFFEEMRKGNSLSRFKIYISMLLSEMNLRDDLQDELTALKRARKNIGSVITTNYDELIQNIFEFNPLLGNDILLSNPYGSVYKIHGCVSDPSKIIITEDDYSNFKAKYDLIRAQLLSLFIHNPIIFLGYNVGDENIKDILKTIFTYVEPNSDIAERIRSNFLLVEYDAGSDNTEITEHDIDLQGFATIRINKIKTDNFTAIYEALSELSLPVSAMDIRKVQSVVKDIYSGGQIKVNFTEDMDTLNNSDKIVVIGSVKTIQYTFHSTSEMMSNYFKIIDESNAQLLKLINKQRIASNQYFPIYGFSRICTEITEEDRLKLQQKTKIEALISEMNDRCKNAHHEIRDIIEDANISHTYKGNAICWAVWHNQLPLDSVEQYLKGYAEKNSTEYKKLLCVYDYKHYQ